MTNNYRFKMGELVYARYFPHYPGIITKLLMIEDRYQIKWQYGVSAVYGEDLIPFKTPDEIFKDLLK